MILLPAIDLYEKKGVRLFKGDYEKMTVYTEDPAGTAADIEAKGAAWIHLVDLEGARDGTTPNFDVVREICRTTGLKAEIGGGIRSMETIGKYLGAGAERVILGTKAVEDQGFLREALKRYGSHIAVGVDARGGMVATHGWTKTSTVEMIPFLESLRDLGVRTAICTDISRDGAMRGTNLDLYRRLCEIEGLDIIASGGVSSIEDIRSLKQMGLYGAILGRAMYTGAVDLQEALRIAKE